MLKQISPCDEHLFRIIMNVFLTINPNCVPNQYHDLLVGRNVFENRGSEEVGRDNACQTCHLVYRLKRHSAIYNISPPRVIPDGTTALKDNHFDHKYHLRYLILSRG